MPSNVAVRLRAQPEALVEGLARIRAELELPETFGPQVEQAAQEAVAAARTRTASTPRSELPFITIDPEGSMDLDQAMHLARGEQGGYVVHYAIADVAAFVEPGGPIDAEARHRGETLYGAEDRVPLHPPALSEDGASLLPDEERPALVWRIALDGDGALTDVHVTRMRVRSVRRWSYAEAQQVLDASDGTGGATGNDTGDATGEGTDAPEVLLLLREIGRLRQQIETDRGGISLPLPEQEVDEAPGGGFTLSFRDPLPSEDWNAQISLLTGIAAAELMLEAGIGLLRTLPPADPRDVARLRRVAAGLRISWPEEWDYPQFVRSLDPHRPAHQAMTVACTRLLRGSGYTAFDVPGGDPAPAQPLHAAIAAPYAHVTAPLRRLGDRFAGEICVAICAGEPVPDWVREALPELPGLLADSARRASRYERAVVDLIETVTLQGRIGEEFAGVITSVEEERPGRGVVLVSAIGVEARVESASDLPLGAEVTVRLESADLAERRVVFRR